VQTRPFGQTGHECSVVILGAFALGKISQGEADAAMERVIAHGVNHIDVAPSYSDAELRLGPWMATHRNRFFLGCKTLERTRTGAREELLRSLDRLCTDHLDLYQLHAVTSQDELDECLKPGGALEALREAQQQGLTRFLGITSHGLNAPAVQLAALERFPFDSVLFPVNFVLWANDDYRRDANRLLTLAAARGVATMAIKAIAREPWGGDPPLYHTWYRPFDDAPSVERALRFTLSQPISGVVTAGDARLLPLNLEGAERFRPMGAREQKTMMATAGQYGSIF
jgi:aryl-alcohol dehydrogenase-like predicted oxidoreductase